MVSVQQEASASKHPAGLAAAPPESDFARWPASWYRLCASRQLSAGPFARDVYDRRLVAYRTPSGEPVVLDATCSHLGADLGNGRVAGDCIRCPFHEWEYNPRGECVRVPQADAPPAFARQRAYPAVERDDSIYFFNGPQASFPLPFFIGETAEDYRAISPTGFVARCSWFMVNAHAFDLQHFATVHGRRLTTPLHVDCPAEFARRSRYRAEIVGERYYDRLLRRLVGREVEISLTIWGGTFAAVTGDFAGRRSRFFVISEPLVNGDTRCEVLVFTPKLSARVVGVILEPLMLCIRRWLTSAYLRDESHALGSPRYNPNSLTEIDRDMIDYFRWAATLE